MEFEEFLNHSNALTSSSEYQEFNRRVNSVASFNLANSEKLPFVKFHEYITEDENNFVNKWRADEKCSRWYNRLVEGILGNVQNGFSRVRYHQNRIEEIEKQINNAFIQTGIRERLGGMTVGGGNTLVLDFEYQSYVLAYRQVLDQLARALAGFFKQDINSYNGIENKIESFKPRNISKAISTLLIEHKNNFKFVLSANRHNSVRDRIAHYEFVPAGVVNISARGLLLAGGGENLNEHSKLLHEVLASRTNCLFSLIENSIGILLAEVRKLEKAV